MSLVVSPAEPGLEALRALAVRCAERRLIHELVLIDVHRWPRMTDQERRTAFDRARRRVEAVCPTESQRGPGKLPERAGS